MERTESSGKASIFSNIVSAVLSLLFVALAVLLIWQGGVIIADRAAAVEAPLPTAAPVVSAARIKTQRQYAVRRHFTGQVEAPQTANLSFEQGGTLTTVLVGDGDPIEQGQVIAMLDDRTLQADVDRLKASIKALRSQLELASLTNKRQKRLQQDGYTSNQNADQARIAVNEIQARIAETEAALAMASIRLEKSKITAPFDGAVNEVLVDGGNTVGGGQTIVTLVKQSDPIFRVGIDPQLATEITVGNKLEITIDGKKYTGRVVSVLPQIDAATRTRVVRARIDGSPALTFGLTGEVVFEQDVPGTGAWVPLAALEDGIRGLWTLHTLSETTPPTVQVAAVEVIHANSTSAFVRGTFADNAMYIANGVHRVVEGQQVRLSAQP